MKKMILTSICIMLLGITFGQTYNNPVALFSFYNNIGNNLKLNSVVIDENYTKLNITYTNTEYAGGWYSINNNSYLVDLNTNKKYILKKAEKITISPAKTTIGLNESSTFTLFFEQIPKNCRQFNFIENELNSSNFKILNINLDIKQIDYTASIEELKKYMPEIVLTYFSDKISWPIFEEVFNLLKEESANDLRLKNFIISDKTYDKADKVDVLMYSFAFNEVRIFLEKNITNDI
ncbi:MAG: hypothetical protein ABI207_05485, partial [Crocinitomicaceae bacterium]